MSVELVALDLDGTLLRSDLSVSERTRVAIEEVRTSGAVVVVATARSPRSVREIARAVGLHGLAICANGAIVFDLDEDRIVQHRPLPAATAHRLVTGLRDRVPGIVFGWELELRFGSEPAYEALREPSWWPRPEGSFPACDPLAWVEPMTKLIGRAPGVDLDWALLVARDLAGDEATATLTGTAFVELMAPGVSKQAALAELAVGLGVDRIGVVAFGDHVTDVTMLEWAGHGVAVANAHAAALAAADEITASNEQDGVAAVLERIRRDQSSSSASVGA